jgi:SAM-dependent methyltransferase
VAGYCLVCQREVAFSVGYAHCFTQADGSRTPNWREHVTCPHCHLNNRMRAAAGCILAATKPGTPIYLTEFVTPLFQTLAAKRRRLVGSEYLRDSTAPGAKNAAGVPHQDVTRLTHRDGSFALVGSFEVLEHVPDYRAALAEFYRVLAPGGWLILTVPFFLGNAGTITRATIDAAGEVTHILPPELHGDPLDDGGALCFYHFGWDFMDALRAAGFAQPHISMFWDPRYGYLGGHQFIIRANKPFSKNFLRSFFSKKRPLS